MLLLRFGVNILLSSLRSFKLLGPLVDWGTVEFLICVVGSCSGLEPFLLLVPVEYYYYKTMLP